MPAISAAAAPKLLLAHYMPWYSAKPYAATWGWHWTMNHFNPDQFVSPGIRDIASQYYPLIGPYDSADPAVLEYHVLLMKLSGIDGVIVDWYGADNFADYAAIDRRALKLLAAVERAKLKFVLCYEDALFNDKLRQGRSPQATPSAARKQRCCMRSPTTSKARPI